MTIAWTKGVKKPRDPFHFYLLEATSKIRAESVDKLTSKQILQIAQTQWAGLTDEQKQKFTEEALEDVQKFRREEKLSEVSLPSGYRM